MTTNFLSVQIFLLVMPLLYISNTITITTSTQTVIDNKDHPFKKETELAFPTNLVHISTTFPSSSQYFLSNLPTDANSAEKICKTNGGSLFSLEIEEKELDLLLEKLDHILQHSEIIWISRNITEKNVKQPKRRHRKLRETQSVNSSCLCPCPLNNQSQTQPPPFPRCNRPKCTGLRPACNEMQSRNCLIKGPPICEAQEKKCTVNNNGTCIIVRQPRCKLISKPVCQLVQSNLGRCRIERAPNCTIVSSGRCRSSEVNCRMEDTPCRHQIKPCKNPCSMRECQTVEPACKVQNCTGANVTTCTKPFVDCLIKIRCQSNVIVCPPRKLHCPPAQLKCEEPMVKCDDPEVVCPQPEVICGKPKFKCGKPVVKCPDPVVNCEPVVTTCERPDILCSDPILRCPAIRKNCTEEKEVTCPVPPALEKVMAVEEGECGIDCCKGQRSKRNINLENGNEKSKCVGLKVGGGGKKERIIQNCNLKFKFICKL